MNIGSGGGVRGWRLALTSTLTALRVLLIPLFIVVAHAVTGTTEPRDELVFRLLALACLLAVGASDVLDGYLARRLGTQSRAGAIADALVDKAVQLSLLTYFTFEGSDAFWNVPAWFLGLVVGRDLVLLGGGLAHVLRRKPVPVEHSNYGRAGTVLIFVLLAAITLDAPAEWLAVLTAVSAIMITISTTLYAVRAQRLARVSEGDG